MLFKHLALPKIKQQTIVTWWKNKHPLITPPPIPNPVSLPNTLPKFWKDTAKRYGKLPYDPAIKKSRPKFIRLTKHKLGTLIPAKSTSAARVHLFQLEKLILQTHEGPKTICYGHGNFVDPQVIEIDHAHASTDIVKRQQNLLSAMNADPAFGQKMLTLFKAENFFIQRQIPGKSTITGSANYASLFPNNHMLTAINSDPKFATKILNEPSMKPYFTVTTTPPTRQFIGTQLFYTTYHNASENLWPLCKKCNGATGKHAQNALTWFKKSPLYGQNFINAHSPFQKNGILLKTKNGKGLGKAAMEWFWSKHLKHAVRTRLANSMFFQLISHSHLIDKRENARAAKRIKLNPKAEHRAFQLRSSLIEEIINNHNLFQHISFSEPNTHHIINESDQKAIITSFLTAGKKGALQKQEQLLSIQNRWETLINKIINSDND